jgi:DNA-binding NtrC family response regulator
MDSTRILVFDDNPAMRKGLSLRLGAHGDEVLFSADALSVKGSPIWSFLIRAPWRRWVRSDGAIAEQRLVRQYPGNLVTGRELESTWNRALQAGAIAFFQKPAEDGNVVGHS